MVPSVIPLEMQLPKADDCLNLDNIDRKTVFGYESFRPGQMEAISSILRGDDTLALLPTGGGKSVVYTVPAIIKQGLTVVIEPLKFIMEEQTEKLREKHVPAFYFNSSLTEMEMEFTINALSNKDTPYAILFTSPECVLSPITIVQCFKEVAQDRTVEFFCS